jgi:hypothetical protein
MTRKLTLFRAKKILRVVPLSKSFWLCTNEYLRSLNTLADALERVSDDVFRYHVDKYKNDFATWVKDAIDDKDLAREISRIKTRYTLVRKIRENIDESKSIVRRYKKAPARKKAKPVRKKLPLRKTGAKRTAKSSARKPARKSARRVARKAIRKSAKKSAQRRVKKPARRLVRKRLLSKPRKRR